MQQEVGFEVAVQRVDELLIIAGAQRGHDQALRLATGKQGGPMRPRQQANFGFDGTHGVEGAPVDPLAVLDDIAAQNRRFQLLQRGT